MTKRLQTIVIFTLFVFLAGCAGRYQERAAWRLRAEKICLAQGRVPLVPLAPISGPGICGMEYPLRVQALSNVPLDKALIMDCPLTAALNSWVERVVQPEARRHFGVLVSRVNVFGAYACRTVDNRENQVFSEHAFGNAVDIAGFELENGKKIIILRDFNAIHTNESAFLREIFAKSCALFSTVLGPGADVFHYNHIHLDLGRHRGHKCQPSLS